MSHNWRTLLGIFICLVLAKWVADLGQYCGRKLWERWKRKKGDSG